MAKNILEKIIVKKAGKIADLKKTISLNSLDELIDRNKSFIKKHSIQKRIRILRKIIYNKQIENGIKKCNIKKGANMYAFEYLKLNLKNGYLNNL